jgi:hypothetical protein
MKLDEITRIKTSKSETEVNDHLAQGYRIIIRNRINLMKLNK